MSIVLILICIVTHMSENVIGIFVSPGSAVAYANSAHNQIVFKVVVGYSDGRNVPLTSGGQRQVQGSWVGFDATTATATCEYPAPQGAFNIPEPATITANCYRRWPNLEGYGYSRLFLTGRHQIRPARSPRPGLTVENRRYTLTTLRLRLNRNLDDAIAPIPKKLICFYDPFKRKGMS
jgi:hypothetical protein